MQEVFTHDPACMVMVATDAAGEGINLQRAHLLVNYDLPWNPNRIEQRFGRVHRIGQEQVCHMWNLVADQTREGQVFAVAHEARRASPGVGWTCGIPRSWHSSRPEPGASVDGLEGTGIFILIFIPDGSMERSRSIPRKR